MCSGQQLVPEHDQNQTFVNFRIVQLNHSTLNINSSSMEIIKSITETQIGVHLEEILNLVPKSQLSSQESPAASLFCVKL